MGYVVPDEQKSLYFFKICGILARVLLIRSLTLKAKEVKIWHPELSVILNKKEISEGCIIHAFVWIGHNVKIGRNTKVQAYAFIPDGVLIGRNCFIGPRVTFSNDKHPPSHGERWEKTVVEDSVVIGAGAVILPGITIGSGAVIGAGAVVTKSVLPNTTVVGNPASVLKE